MSARFQHHRVVGRLIAAWVVALACLPACVDDSDCQKTLEKFKEKEARELEKLQRHDVEINKDIKELQIATQLLGEKLRDCNDGKKKLQEEIDRLTKKLAECLYRE